MKRLKTITFFSKYWQDISYHSTHNCSNYRKSADVFRQKGKTFTKKTTV